MTTLLLGATLPKTRVRKKTKPMLGELKTVELALVEVPPQLEKPKVLLRFLSL